MHLQQRAAARGTVSAKLPPSSVARSRIDVRPTPVWWCLGRPQPSSRTSSSSVSSTVIVTAARRARACRATFVSASCAILNAATSTAAGSGGIGSGASTSQVSCGSPALSGRLLAHRAGQAELVQRGRAQGVDDPAHVGHGPLDARGHAVQERVRGLGVAGQHAPRGVDGQDGAGERGAEPVVEVAPQPAALLLARGDEPFA